MIYLFTKIYKKAPHNVQKKISLQKRKYNFLKQIQSLLVKLKTYGKPRNHLDYHNLGHNTLTQGRDITFELLLP